MAFGGFGGDESADEASVFADINITPLVDVVLVLLLIFMVTAPMLAMTLEVELPEVEAGAPASATAIVITVGKQGAVALDDSILSLEDVVAQAKRRHDAGGGAVYLRGDRDASYQQVLAVLDALRGAGLSDVALVTKPLGSGTSGGKGAARDGARPRGSR